MEWPVEPKPPREVDELDEEEEDELLLLLLLRADVLLELNPTDVELGGRPDVDWLLR